VIGDFELLEGAEELLAAHQARTLEVFREIVRAAVPDPARQEHLMLRAGQPKAFSLAWRAREGVLEPQRALEDLAFLASLPDSQVEHMAKGGVYVVQDSRLVSKDEDRGVRMEPADEDGRESRLRLEEHLECATRALGPAWRHFISPVKNLTFVEVVGKQGIPFFSGSNNELFGAMQCSPQSSAWITAEVLTHEAAHMWLSLFEDQEEFADNAWSDPVYPSPWREDLRPLAGLVHGVYVFTSVAHVLALWNERSGKDQEVVQRLSLVVAQVEFAIAEVRRSQRVTEWVLGMCADCELRLASIAERVPEGLRVQARARVVELARTREETRSRG
jgi:hypothetical protein